jgi:hypothetical protein
MPDLQERDSQAPSRRLLTLLDLVQEGVLSPAFGPSVGADVPNDETPSDIRLKTDICQVGTTKHDLPLYTFRYIGSDDEYEGVMAQDVLKVMPTAVSVGKDGYYRVNYKMLGIEMRRKPTVARRLWTLLDLAEVTPEGVLSPAFGPSVRSDVPHDAAPPPPSQIARGFGPGWGPSVGADIEIEANKPGTPEVSLPPL